MCHKLGTRFSESLRTALAYVLGWRHLVFIVGDRWDLGHEAAPTHGEGLKGHLTSSMTWGRHHPAAYWRTGAVGRPLPDSSQGAMWDSCPILAPNDWNILT